MSWVSELVKRVLPSIGSDILVKALEDQVIQAAAASGEATVELMLHVPSAIVVEYATKHNLDSAHMLAEQDRILHELASWYVELATGTPPVVS